jgi:peptidoglycan/LPS O-acetylase OafA/YrhL
MQFYILSPLFLYPLWRWEAIGLGILAISTLASILCPGLMVYFMKVPPTTIGTIE